MPGDWPTLEILPVHWLSIGEKADSRGERPPEACTASACCGACAMLFPDEPRANFRRRDLAAELGTLGGCGRCVSRGRDRRRGPRSSDIDCGAPSGRGRRPETEPKGGARRWEVPGLGARLHRWPPSASQLRTGRAAGVGAQGSVQVRLLARRVLRATLVSP